MVKEIAAFYWLVLSQYQTFNLCLKEQVPDSEMFPVKTDK